METVELEKGEVNSSDLTNERVSDVNETNLGIGSSGSSNKDGSRL